MTRAATDRWADLIEGMSWVPTKHILTDIGTMCDESGETAIKRSDIALWAKELCVGEARVCELLDEAETKGWIVLKRRQDSETLTCTIST